MIKYGDFLTKKKTINFCQINFTLRTKKSQWDKRLLIFKINKISLKNQNNRQQNNAKMIRNKTNQKNACIHWKNDKSKVVWTFDSISLILYF